MNATAPMQSSRLVLELDITDLSDEQLVSFRSELTQLVQRYTSSTSTGQDEQRTAEGWTRATLSRALELLERDGGWVQAKVVRRAIENGGRASREEVYELGNYDHDRMLRGFTRPTKRVVEGLKQRGELDSAAPSLLEPFYNGNQADGFEVPKAVLSLLN
ncbi:hypothetical protein [Saccharomonospora halophila]|uniref:hypothetical protein n=1 Tax=Saccharomonospora halophila TaxID=129922 RepID=UPI0003679C2E|nr:hypothetical protein [Saccharomonospora halophila]